MQWTTIKSAECRPFQHIFFLSLFFFRTCCTHFIKREKNAAYQIGLSKNGAQVDLHSDPHRIRMDLLSVSVYAITLDPDLLIRDGSTVVAQDLHHWFACYHPPIKQSPHSANGDTPQRIKYQNFTVCFCSFNIYRSITHG
jgi:hypothetical protein